MQTFGLAPPEHFERTFNIHRRFNHDQIETRPATRPRRYLTHQEKQTTRH